MRAGNACTRTSIVLRAPPAVPKPVAQVTVESSAIDDHWLLPMCTLLALEDEQQQKSKEREAFEGPGHLRRDSPILFGEDCSLEVPPMKHRRADVHRNPTTPGGPQTPSPGPVSANWEGEDGAVQCRFGPQTPTSPQRLGPGVLLQLDQLFEQAFAFRAWKCVTTRQQHSSLTRGRKHVSGRTLIDRDGVFQHLRQVVASWQHAIRARAQIRANLQRASNYVRLCGLRLGFRTMRRHVTARNAERLKHSLARRRSRPPSEALEVHARVDEPSAAVGLLFLVLDAADVLAAVRARVHKVGAGAAQHQSNPRFFIWVRQRCRWRHRWRRCVSHLTH